LNARQVFRVTTYEEVLRGDEVDVYMTMDNFTLVKEGESTLTMVNVDPNDGDQTDLEVERMFENDFKWGKRVALGSTGTERGTFICTYFGSEFPNLKVLTVDGREEVVPAHRKLYDVSRKTKNAVKAVLKTKVQTGEIRMGIAHSQLMAGAGNSLEDLARAGYAPNTVLEKVFGSVDNKPQILEDEDREKLVAAIKELGPSETARWRAEIEKRMEIEGPKRLAIDKMGLILSTARAKRERLRDRKTGELPAMVSVLSVDEGNSGTGKSENTAAIKALCGL